MLYEILEKKAIEGLDDLIMYVDSDRNLTYEENEFEEDKEIEIEVYAYDEDMCTEIVGTYYFDDEGNFIRGV